MGIIILLAKLFHRKLDIANSIFLSLLLILIYNPFTILDLGLMLSFGGTIGIVLYSNKLINILTNKDLGFVNRIKNYIITMFSVTLSAQILIFPIVLYNFNMMSYTFVLSGLIAEPFFSVIVILGFLGIILSYIFFPLGKLIFFIVELFLKMLLVASDFISSLPFAIVLVKTPNIIIVIFYYVVVCILIYIWNVRKIETCGKGYIRKLKYRIIQKISCKKILCISMIIISIYYCTLEFYKLISKDLNIYFIDVGQGDSTLIVSPNNRVILIDGGGSGDINKYDIGDKLLVPYLLDRGISRIDYMLVSHFDSDHSEGLLAVMKNLKVDCIIISMQSEISNEYKDFISVANVKKIEIKVVEKGDRISIEKNIYIDILYPEKDLRFGDLNNNSIVAKLVYNSFSMLFVGDIEREAESQIVDRYGDSNKLRSTVLKVAHHRFKNINYRRIFRKNKAQNCISWSRRRQ
jgi:competence protein ComEC